MSFRTSMQSVAEAARKIAGPAGLDVRLHQLTVRTRTWSGGRPDAGVATDVNLVLPAHYPVREINAQDVWSSGGKYKVGDLLVDHITPSDGAGTGYTLAQLDPPGSNAVEVTHILAGPHAGEYTCINARHYRPFTIQLVLRSRA